MHTLTELDPKAGEVVTYNGKDYYVLSKSSGYFTLRPLTGEGGDWWVVPDNVFAQEKKWTFQPKDKRMRTLTELNPKVGDTVTYFTALKAPTYTVLGRTESGWRFRCEDGMEFHTDENSWFARRPNWYLKPEKKVTVADLNLTVGDRISSGDRTGTYIGKRWEGASDAQVEVVWDWGQRLVYHSGTEVDWQLLPKPEPTVASLGLKVGDPVLNTRNGRCALVYAVCDSFVNLRYCCGDTLTLFQTDPANRLKKLEVSK